MPLRYVRLLRKTMRRGWIEHARRAACDRYRIVCIATAGCCVTCTKRALPAPAIDSRPSILAGGAAAADIDAPGAPRTAVEGPDARYASGCSITSLANGCDFIHSDARCVLAPRPAAVR